MFKNNFGLLESFEDITLQSFLIKEIDAAMDELDMVYQNLSDKLQEIEAEDQDGKQAFMFYVRDLLNLDIEEAKKCAQGFISKLLTVDKIDIKFVTKMSVLFNELLEHETEDTDEITFSKKFVGNEANVVESEVNTYDVTLGNDEIKRVQYYIGVFLSEITPFNNKILNLGVEEMFNDFTATLNLIQKGIVINSILVELDSYESRNN